jgi:hypothetical protein
MAQSLAGHALTRLRLSFSCCWTAKRRNALRLRFEVVAAPPLPRGDD